MNADKICIKQIITFSAMVLLLLACLGGIMFINCSADKQPNTSTVKEDISVQQNETTNEIPKQNVIIPNEKPDIIEEQIDLESDIMSSEEEEISTCPITVNDTIHSGFVFNPTSSIKSKYDVWKGDTNCMFEMWKSDFIHGHENLTIEYAEEFKNCKADFKKLHKEIREDLTKISQMETLLNPENFHDKESFFEKYPMIGVMDSNLGKHLSVKEQNELYLQKVQPIRDLIKDLAQTNQTYKSILKYDQFDTVQYSIVCVRGVNLSNITLVPLYNMYLPQLSTSREVLSLIFCYNYLVGAGVLIEEVKN